MSDAEKGAWLGRDVEVTLDRLAHGGASVGRVDGRVVFVRGALPRERVRARVVDDRKPAFCHAELVEILDASPHRQQPACVATAAGAGCCDLSHSELGFARELKTEVLADTLARVGRLESIAADVESLIGVDDDGRAWRVRARLTADGQGHPGFHAHHDNRIVTQQCAALHPAMYDALDGLRFAPGSEVIVVRDSHDDVHVVEVQSEPAQGRRDSRAAAQRRRAQRTVSATHLVAGSGQATFVVGQREWTIEPTGFWQAHRDAPQVYSDAVVALVSEYAPARPVHVWDLYGGAGVFSAALLDSNLDVASVEVVDTDRAALAAGERALNDLRVTTVVGGVGPTVAQLQTPDVVVCDPPRSGLGRDVVASIAAADPSTIVHVGCDIAAFARDLRFFTENGYRVARIRGFDAFPMSHHVEAIAVLVADSR